MPLLFSVLILCSGKMVRILSLKSSLSHLNKKPIFYQHYQMIIFRSVQFPEPTTF